MLILTKIAVAAGLAALLSLAPMSAMHAAEIDFSCMSYKVWPKSHLSNQFREYDIVLKNNCPGAVNWSMCIERLDPDTYKVWETLTPAGYVEPEKKSRVNLQTQKDETPATFRQRFEEFYVSIGYAVDSAAKAECVARQCESQKSDLRAAIRGNEKAWEKAEKALAGRIADECPGSGWDKAAREECAKQLRESSGEQIQAFSLRDTQLREEMAAIDPDRCTVWSGDLVKK